MLNEREILGSLFLPDGTDRGLSSFITGRSGSGKTFLMTQMVNQTRSLPEFKDNYVIYLSVKEESYFTDVEPTSDVEALFTGLTKSKTRIGVFYPADPTTYQEEVDLVIQRAFEVQAENPDASFTILLDDINVLGAMSSRGRPTEWVTKALIAGRSKRIKLVMVLHRLGGIFRIANSSMNGGVVMAISEMDDDYAQTVLGVSLADHYDELKRNQYSWAFVDVLTGEIARFRPMTPN